MAIMRKSTKIVTLKFFEITFSLEVDGRGLILTVTEADGFMDLANPAENMIANRGLEWTPV